MIHKELTRDYTRQMFNSDYSAYDVAHMTEKSIKAFIKLRQIGCPVDCLRITMIEVISG